MNELKIQEFESLILKIDIAMSLVEASYNRLKALNKHSTEFERRESLEQFNQFRKERDDLRSELDLLLKEVLAA